MKFQKGHVPHNKNKFIATRLLGKRFTRWEVLAFSRRVEGVRATGKPSVNLVWLCLCDCGTQKEVYESCLITGTSRSCGCLAREIWRSKLLPNDASLKNELYADYKNKARKAERSFGLSLVHFVELIESDCFYCGIPPLQVSKSSNSPLHKHNGIDRVDSAKGYDIGNVVPCCKACNRAKHAMSVESFLGLVHRIYERHLMRSVSLELPESEQPEEYMVERIM